MPDSAVPGLCCIVTRRSVSQLVEYLILLSVQILLY